MVASVDRVLSEPHVSGTATACKRDMLSTIGSGPHGSTAATASNLAILSSALGIFAIELVVTSTLTLEVTAVTIVVDVCTAVTIDRGPFDDVLLLVLKPLLLLLLRSLSLRLQLILLLTLILLLHRFIDNAVVVANILIVPDDVVVTDGDDATEVVDHRLVFAGEQLIFASTASPHVPISYLRFVAVTWSPIIAMFFSGIRINKDS